MKMSFLILISLITAGLFPSCVKSSQDIGTKAIAKYSKELKRKYGLQLSGSGGSFNDNKITQTTTYYWCDQDADIQEARRVFILSSRDFLGQINTDPSVKPYLDPYPFTYQDIDFSIHFEPINDSPHQVYYAALIKGKVHYWRLDKTTERLEKAYSETYQEASKKVGNPQVK